MFWVSGKSCRRMGSLRERPPMNRSIFSVVLILRARVVRSMQRFRGYSMQKHLQQRVPSNTKSYPKKSEGENPE